MNKSPVLSAGYACTVCGNLVHCTCVAQQRIMGLAAREKETGLRPELAAFAKIMEVKLAKHDAEFHQDDYKRTRLEDLIIALEHHVGKAKGQRTKGAWADVANFAMMIAHHCA